jgi:Tfp pilus tip-associated adhesin PilY1
MIMLKRLTFISVVSAVLLTCQSANAQWQWMLDVCGGHAQTANCRRDSHGSVHHDGNVYDPSKSHSKG